MSVGEANEKGSDDIVQVNVAIAFVWRDSPLRSSIILGLAALVLLTSPAFAERMLFACSGTHTIYDVPEGRPQIVFEEVLFIDLESGDVFGAIGSYKIVLIEENAIMFTAGTRGQDYYAEGYMDRYSGHTQAYVYSKSGLVSVYELNCKP